MTPTPEQLKTIHDFMLDLDSDIERADDRRPGGGDSHKIDLVNALTALLASWRERGEGPLLDRVGTLERSVAEKRADVATLECEVASLRRQLEEAQAEVERWKGVATHRWELVQGMELAISVRDSEIDRLRATLAERDSEVERLRESNRLLVEAVEAARTMWRAGDKPRKLEDALTWVQNDELAESKIVKALDSARRIREEQGRTELIHDNLPSGVYREEQEGGER